MTDPTKVNGEEARQPEVNDESGSSSPSQGLSKNQEKNEAKRKAKMEKFLAKQAKLQAKEGANAEKKDKPKKEKKEKPTKTEAVEEEYIDNTPAGEKKDMSRPMASAYNPKAVEAAWYAWWEKKGFFKPQLVNGKPLPKGTYVIPIPPPNVTGNLHLGHALTNSIQDALIRWNRMRGYTSLYVPGCDHAGIATQVVVEKRIMKERNLTRHDLGREAFLAEVFKWKEDKEKHIYNQLRRMGSSYDWSRAHFTMDPKLSEAVTEAFVRLHEEGVIYRENRLVNWCTKLKTALSNLEVENKELEGRTLLSVPDHDPDRKYEFGVLHKFAYPIENSDEKIIVATTRIETMLGDTAIAIHSSDARYKHLHGKFAVHPFNNRRLPIVCDDIAVDPAFGTGAVKITPAHDFNDYEVGKRHALPFITVISDDGRMNAEAAPFEGMKRFDCRVAVIKALQEKGLYEGKVDNKMMIPICTRSGNVVEPLMKPQWWVRCGEMAEMAMKAVEKGEIEIQPKQSEKEWFRWLGNIQDWCISRQLWWGHQVPAYFVNIKGVEQESLDDKNWVSARNEKEAMEKALKRFPGVKAADITLERDPDVLDTWFSSGLWPFSIMGWPNKTKDMELFYPNTLLETGWDILFFWVARMVMLGLKLTGQVPFRKVFCHAMVRDAHGRKMSKSLGNVIDPIWVMEGISLQGLHESLYAGNLDPREVVKAVEGQKKDFPNGIPECGTDALRFALCAYTSAGRDINLDILRVEGYRKFCNKLWNATRFALMKLGDDFQPRPTSALTGQESLASQWILHRLNKTITEVNTQFDQMNFMATTNAIYNFWLYELCDVFIEVVKPVIDGSDEAARRSARDTLYTCLDAGLKLLHPFMPFVTEELWQRLPRRPSDKTESVSLAAYPETVPEWNNPEAENNYALVNQVVGAARSMLAEYNIRSNATIYVTASTTALESMLRSQTLDMTTLIKGCKQLIVLGKDASLPVGCALTTLNENVNVLLLVKGIVNFDEEINKANKRLEKARQSAGAIKKRMDSPQYEKMAPEAKEFESNKLKDFEAEIDALTHAIQNFMKLRDQ